MVWSWSALAVVSYPWFFLFFHSAACLVRLEKVLVAGLFFFFRYLLFRSAENKQRCFFAGFEDGGARGSTHTSAVCVVHPYILRSFFFCFCFSFFFWFFAVAVPRRRRGRGGKKVRLLLGESGSGRETLRERDAGLGWGWGWGSPSPSPLPVCRRC